MWTDDCTTVYSLPLGGARLKIRTGCGALAVAALFILVLGLAVRSGVSWVKAGLTPPRPGDQQMMALDITRGSGTWAIARALADKGLIRDPGIFRWLARYRGVDGRLQAGEYLLSPGMTPDEIIGKLVQGDVITYSFTVPEGYTVEQVVKLLVSRRLADEAALRALFQDKARVAAYLPEGLEVVQPLEGYLFPDTYTITRETGVAGILELMVSRLEAAFTPSLRVHAEELGLSIHEVLTLASIVEREARVDAERPVIAAVYRNRLRIGMKLDADPTVRYALGKFDGPVLLKDLEVESPYNTYRNSGLPPGPIANPGLAAIEAVLNPADVDYLYFVARCDGSGGHVFADTFEEHTRNVWAQQKPGC